MSIGHWFFRLFAPLLRWFMRPWVGRLIRGIGRMLRLRPEGLKQIQANTEQWMIERRMVKTYQLVGYSSHLNLNLPKTIQGQVHWKFRKYQQQTAPSCYIAKIPGGSVVGRNGAIVTADGTLLTDLSREWFFRDQQHPLLFRFKLPAPTHLEGTTISLATRSGWNYYHWLLDLLPRIAVLERGGVNIQEADQVIVNGGRGRYRLMPKGVAWENYHEHFQLDSIQPFFKAPWRLLDSRPQPFFKASWRLLDAGPGKNYQCENLIVPSHVGLGSDTPAWVVQWLCQKFISGPLPRRERIFVSRRKAEYRYLTNQAAVSELLGHWGFREVVLEQMPFQEQVMLFAAAEAVVSQNGSGLANILFCQPGTVVVEIFSPDYVQHCFWVLAEHAKLNYWYLIGAGKQPPDGVDRQGVEKDITVNLKDLEATLDAAGIK